jgi:pilus assembly protein CpaB
VLQNITVLSAGQTTQTDGKSQPIIAPVVTLMVSPAEAESLTLANAEGRIQLVLRNSTDRDSAPTSGRRLRDLYGVEPVVDDAPAEAVPRRVRRPALPADARIPQAVPTAEPEQMIVILGAAKKVVVFSRDGGAQ